MLAMVLALLVIASGALSTYAFERAAPFVARLAMGVVLGFVALTYVAFVLSCLIGLSLVTLGLLFVFAGAWFAVAWRRYHLLLANDARVFAASLKSRETWATRFFLLLLCGVLWAALRRAMYQTPDGIFTGYVNNLGDLPLHLQIIGSFAHGNNFPPQSPIFAGARFSYPFMADFLSAVWLRLGLNIEYSMLLQNFALMLATIVLLRHFTWQFVRNRVAVALAPWLLIWSGGLGWMLLWSEARNTPQGMQSGLIGLVLQPIHFYTKHDDANLQWSNSLAMMFITQRSMVLGAPILLLVATLWWNNRAKFGGEIEDRVLDVAEEMLEVHRNNRMLLSGVLVGALPLIHAHFFAAIMGVAFLWTLLSISQLRLWLRFWIPALLLSVPQLFWLVGGDRPKDAFAWQSGWMSAQSETQTLAQNWTAFLGFWWQNAGLFLPLLFAVWLWAWLKRKRRDAVLNIEHLKFYAPFFVMGFIIPNLFKLAPWVWDNTKVLLVWWIFSCPFVALFLAWLWNGARGRKWRRALTILAFAALTFSGAIDSWRGISSNSEIGTQNSETRIYGRAEMDVAQFLATLPSGGTVLSAPTYNTPASLAGKMAVMGYNGHLLSYGIDYNARESEVRDFLSGARGSESILKKYDVRYVVFGTMERDYLRTQNPPREVAPASFWKQWKEVGHIGEYSIFETQAK